MPRVFFSIDTVLEFEGILQFSHWARMYLRFLTSAIKFLRSVYKNEKKYDFRGGLLILLGNVSGPVELQIVLTENEAKSSMNLRILVEN